MKRILIVVMLVVFCPGTVGALYALANCGDTWQAETPATTTEGDCGTNLGELTNRTIINHWKIFWTDSYDRPDARASGNGQCKRTLWITYVCDPIFDAPYWSKNTASLGEWNQRVRNGYMNQAQDACLNSLVKLDNFHRHDCTSGGGGGGCGEFGGCPPGCFYNCSLGYCTDTSGNSCDSPVLIDVLGDGFNLTDAANGVDFDLDRDSVKEHLSWTSVNSDDAFLALDRNSNGIIDDGRELFGNFTPQPASPTANGFIALAEFDRPAKGGNEDGQIDNRDSIFSSLRLWQDTNHNGNSESSELHRLSSLGLASIGLKYKEAKHTDQHGNWFRYRSKVTDVRGAQLGRWAWDVFLVRQ